MTVIWNVTAFSDEFFKWPVADQSPSSPARHWKSDRAVGAGLPSLATASSSLLPAPFLFAPSEASAPAPSELADPPSADWPSDPLSDPPQAVSRTKNNAHTRTRIPILHHGRAPIPATTWPPAAANLSKR